MTSIIIARAGENGLGAPLLDSMYRLRSDTFHRRLGWEVRVDSGREHDWFDLIGPHYLVAHDGASNALGCCRLLPTTGPNMLGDVFPFLLDGNPAPSSSTVMEVSRFAVSSTCAGDGFGFGDVPSAMLAAMGRAAGLRTGLYTSPHLLRFAERIQIDGTPIDYVRRTPAGRCPGHPFDRHEAGHIHHER